MHFVKWKEIQLTANKTTTVMNICFHSLFIPSLHFKVDNVKHVRFPVISELCRTDATNSQLMVTMLLFKPVWNHILPYTTGAEMNDKMTQC